MDIEIERDTFEKVNSTERFWVLKGRKEPLHSENLSLRSII
jgi:hypothetical protein